MAGSSAAINFQSELFCSDSAQPGRLRCQLHHLASGANQRDAMSITTPFPGAADSQKPAQEAFEREVGARVALVPNFLRSALAAPFVVHELWRFAKAAYLDAPIPTLLKERLFVYLSRFCEVRYCITRHCDFLLGLSRAAGDPDAQAMTITLVIRLLQRPVPNDGYLRPPLNGRLRKRRPDSRGTATSNRTRESAFIANEKNWEDE
jgi:hypothetical protein